MFLNETIAIDKPRLQPIIDEALNNGRVIKVDELPQKDWLSIRHMLGLGASDFASALGINKYKTPFQLWQDKVSGEVEIFSNKFTNWGNLLEPPILEDYSNQVSLDVKKDQYMRIHPTHDYLFANLDGLVYVDGNIVGGVEAKSTVNSVYKSWQDNPDENPQGIPMYQYIQIQGQFSCARELDLQYIDHACLVLDQREVKVKRITPDWDYIEKQDEALTAWYNYYVVPMAAPPMDADELSHITPMAGSFIESDPHTSELCRTHTEKNQQYKSLEKELKGIKNEIKEFLGDNELLTSAGDVLATFKEISKKEYTVKANKYRMLSVKK